MLLDGFAAATAPNLSLVIAGLPLDGPSAELVTAHARRDERIRPLLGFVPDEAVAELFDAADAAIVSRGDGGTSGALILVLPYYKNTFDHRREPTSVDHMFSDYEQNIGEDDLTHLPEILEKHDLSKDPGAKDIENFRIRSLNNIENRCLHHHVFDEHNSRELIERSGFVVHSVDRAFPFHLCLLATKAS